MNIPCCTRSLCLDPANPFENLSAENPDSDVFFGYSSGWYQNVTPIGNTWGSSNCNVQVTSAISQEDADLKAAQLQIECTIGGDTSGGGGGGGNPCQTNPSGNCVQLFQNGPALCTILCPDGLPFNFVFQAGQVTAPSQAEAQLIAQSLACIVGQDERLCLSAIPNACLNQPYFAVISTQGGTPPFNFSVIAGSLPPGVTAQPSALSLVIGGIPTATGNYSFTVRVVDAFGIFFVKTYTLSVLTINSPPNGSTGATYNFTFTVTGGTAPYTFSLSSGSLPAGLTMDSGGNITGTPTGSGASSFAVGFTDSTGASCVKNVTMTIGGCDCTTQWFPSNSACRVRIAGYFDGMVAQCPGALPNGGAVWDGTLSRWDPPPNAIFGEYAAPINPPNSTMAGGALHAVVLFTNGVFCILGISGDNGGVQVPTWTGQLNSTCPIGVYTQIAGCAGGPATITVEGYTP